MLLLVVVSVDFVYVNYCLQIKAPIRIAKIVRSAKIRLNLSVKAIGTRQEKSAQTEARKERFSDLPRGETRWGVR